MVKAENKKLKFPLSFPPDRCGHPLGGRPLISLAMALTKPLSGSPMQLNRTLDRVLEEAQNSGALVLSGQKLKEYPSAIGEFPFQADLSDLQSVDLSANRLSEVPIGLCRCTRLESADFSGNAIRHVPAEIAALRFLRVLTLDRNLIITLPLQVCRLRQLQILSVRSNKLVSIPDEISALEQLQELDLSCNELDRLPSGIFGLVNLRRLNVRRNNLIELPEIPAAFEALVGGAAPPSTLSSGVLCRLVSLDVSSNRIQRLPLSLRFLKDTLQSLSLDHNPLALPPAHVGKKGRLHVFKCLEKEFLKEKCKGEVMSSIYPPATATKHVRKSNSFGSALNGSKSYKMPAAPERFQKQQQQPPAKINGLKKPRSLTVANGNVFKDAAEQHRLLQQQPPPPHLAPPQKAGTRDSGYHGAVDAESCWPGVSPASTTPSSSSPGGLEEEAASPSAVWSGVPAPTMIASQPDGAYGIPLHASTPAFSSESNAASSGGMNSSGTLTPASPNTVTPPAVRHFINPHDGISPPRLGNPFEGYSPPRDQHSLEEEFNQVINKRFPSVSSTIPAVPSGDVVDGGDAIFDVDRRQATPPRHPRQSSLGESAFPPPPLPPSSSQRSPHSTQPTFGIHSTSSSLASPSLNLDGSYQSTLPASSQRHLHQQLVHQQQQTQQQQPAISHTVASSPASPSESDGRFEREKTVVRIPIAEMAKPVLPASSSSSSSSSLSSSSTTMTRSTTSKSGGSGAKKSAATTSVRSMTYSTSSLPRVAKNGSPSRDGLASSSSSARARNSTRSVMEGGGPSSSSSSTSSHLKSATSRIPGYPSSSISPLVGSTPRSQAGRPNAPTGMRSSGSPTSDDRNNNKDVTTNNNGAASRSASYRALPPSSIPSPTSASCVDEDSLVSADGSPSSFTIRREEQRLREDVQIVRGMRSQLETRLKIQLPDSPAELSKSLSDGVVLCHLINHLRPRAVPTIHVPSATTPKLTYAKCARNVENFLEACRKIGLTRDDLCAQNVVLEGKSVTQIARTVDALFRCASSSNTRRTTTTNGGSGNGGGGARHAARGYAASSGSPSSRDLESDLTTVTQV